MRKDGACEIRAHQEQAAGRGTVGRREPAKHKAQCKACRHPELARVEAEWTIGALADVAAANTLRCSERSWQRHAAYKGLYLERANRGLLPFLFGLMDGALAGKPTLAAGVTAAALAYKISQGGERIIIEAVDRLREQDQAALYKALDAVAKVEGPVTSEQFAEIFRTAFHEALASGEMMNAATQTERPNP